ncbi:putative reverse transcriptase domain-containing protein [Tanacetum coccineum]
MCIPFTGIAQFPDVAHNLEILQDQEDCDESERSGKKQDGSNNHRNNNQDSGNNDKFLLNFSLQLLDSQQSKVFPESCTLLFMPNVVVETQESVVMLPEIASSAARLATSSKMARRTLRQVHLVTLTRKPDISGRVFAITQNQTTNISEELPGISSIRDVEYDIEFASGAKPIAEAPYRISPVKCCMYGVDKSSFHKFLDKFVIMLIDDILIFSKSNEEHEDHLRTVIQILRQEKLYAKFSKCKFWLSKVVFLGHVVPAEGITMDPAKVEVVAKWPRSTSETEARSFLGLAGHYHRVVEGSSRLALPLTKLTRKDEKLYGPESERRSLKNLSNV